jgi:hypothetical protein
MSGHGSSSKALQGEIIKLLSENGEMHAGRIMNKLNGQGRDIPLDDVERELNYLEASYVVERMWRLKETPIQSDPPDGAPRSTDPRSD